MKVRITGTDKEFEIPSYMTVDKGGHLYNRNTRKKEALEGDQIYIGRNGKWGFYTIIGYTNYQCVETKEIGGIVLSVNEIGPTLYKHKNTACVISEK